VMIADSPGSSPPSITQDPRRRAHMSAARKALMRL
jgi:Na+/melibiose symporter-like transporter